MYRFKGAQGAGNRSSVMWHVGNRDLATAPTGRAAPGQGDMARCSNFERRVRQAMSLIWPLAVRQFHRRHSYLESRVRFRDGLASIRRRTNSMSSCVISRPRTVVVSSMIRYYHRNETESSGISRIDCLFPNSHENLKKISKKPLDSQGGVIYYRLRFWKY